MISGVSTPAPRVGQFENSDQGDYEFHRHPAETGIHPALRGTESAGCSMCGSLELPTS